MNQMLRFCAPSANMMGEIHGLFKDLNGFVIRGSGVQSPPPAPKHTSRFNDLSCPISSDNCTDPLYFPIRYANSAPQVCSTELVA